MDSVACYLLFACLEFAVPTPISIPLKIPANPITLVIGKRTASVRGKEEKDRSKRKAEKEKHKNNWKSVKNGSTKDHLAALNWRRTRLFM